MSVSDTSCSMSSTPYNAKHEERNISREYSIPSTVGTDIVLKLERGKVLIPCHLPVLVSQTSSPAACQAWFEACAFPVVQEPPAESDRKRAC